MSNKWKVVILLGILAFCVPLYYISTGAMKKREAEWWAKERDPNAPAELWKLARLYDATSRPDDSDIILKEWLKHWGGNEAVMFEEKRATYRGFRYFIWEPEWFNDDTEETKRPEHYPEKPHPLTAKVINLRARHFEDVKQYSYADHLYKIVRDYLRDDQEAYKVTEMALTRMAGKAF